MVKRAFLAVLLAALASLAHADLIEFSGFGGYTTVGMKQVNNAMTASPKELGAVPGAGTDISDGYLVGLDLRTGALIPIPCFELGLRAEYVGANPGEAKGTYKDQAYDVTEDASMADVMLGLDFDIGLPAGLNLGLSAWGGYGEGFIRQSATLAGESAPDLYYGGAPMGEAEAKLGYKLYSALGIYAFGGERFADLGVFEDPAKDKFGAVIPGGNGAPEVDFTGITAGLGLNLDF
jgi:opacity protein-like surface antigen